MIDADDGPRVANDDDYNGKMSRIEEGGGGGGRGGSAHRHDVIVIAKSGGNDDDDDNDDDGRTRMQRRRMSVAKSEDGGGCDNAKRGCDDAGNCDGNGDPIVQPQHPFERGSLHWDGRSVVACACRWTATMTMMTTTTPGRVAPAMEAMLATN